MIEKMVRICRLYDYYGVLLTKRQQKCIEFHYLQDMSLGEIGTELSVSRQAINDNLRRAEDILERFEVKLKLMNEADSRNEVLDKVMVLLQEPTKSDTDIGIRLREAQELLMKILK